MSIDGRYTIQYVDLYQVKLRDKIIFGKAEDTVVNNYFIVSFVKMLH